MSVVEDAWGAQRAAMVSGDSGILDELLDDSFSLTHMTGYVQPKNEWLADITSGQMTYHSIRDVAVSVEGDEARAQLIARTTTEATIWGSHGTWRLQLRIDYDRRPGGWIATRSVASAW